MRLPRRIPWSSVSELDQVCTWIYTDVNDLDEKLLAINRLSAWNAITPLPHALESTLALLVVILQDKNSSTKPFSQLALRQSYATAIIRLVNGLVDPLQLGAYARSIASIAAQLGLPAWFVELRHASTHEDLPSLELLREAAQQSMGWLLHNYFLPTLNPVSPQTRQLTSLRPIAPVLKQYKAILKALTRDGSLRTRYKQEVNTIIRDIERWIAEAAVAANIAVGELGWDASHAPTESGMGSTGDVVDLKEKWALDQFCDILLEKGGLVPLSKKKRVYPQDKFWPPQPSLSLWTPLLKHIQLLHPVFIHTLCNRIIFNLLSVGAATMNGQSGVDPQNVISTSVKKDLSHELGLARWVMWLVDTYTIPDSGTGADMNLKKDVTVSLMQSLGHEFSHLNAKDNRAAEALVQAICQSSPSYRSVVDFLTKPQSQFPKKIEKEWCEKDMATMTDRLVRFTSTEQSESVLQTTSSTTDSVAGGAFDATNSIVVDPDTGLGTNLPGWLQLDTTSWKACPIGVFNKI